MSDIVEWHKEPQDHDYPAAGQYLLLTYSGEMVDKILADLRAGGMVQFAAKDILRASGLPDLDNTNPHVRKDLAKIKSDEKLSPVLLVRNAKLGRVDIADGYHRVCAAHYFNENTMVPCKFATGVYHD